MINKIQISLAIVVVITVAIWAYHNHQSPSPLDQIVNKSSKPVPEVTNSTVGTGSQIYAKSGEFDLKTLSINNDQATNKTLKQTVATYTNSEGQQIEIIVTSGSKGADIVPIN